MPMKKMPPDLPTALTEKAYRLPMPFSGWNPMIPMQALPVRQAFPIQPAYPIPLSKRHGQLSVQEPIRQPCSLPVHAARWEWQVPIQHGNPLPLRKSTNSRISLTDNPNTSLIRVISPTMNVVQRALLSSK